ncbi:hypothetical protein ALQ24_02336 [Pseudomonas syringae pv. antirrhini]|uniref:hypothetical protein n=1 Tax=Pseudomonas TaxID=286 RepID=UPI00070A2BAA|nr:MULTISPECIES: hypothetical protein [Pseudomonas]RMP39050.1 hypothetical protein ALQ24_02336 [Pseudomonas syringae pv. antirrhini]WIN05880.1 hypothetical protein QQF68_20115 [Pseudomonas syringae pv. antirrhini str. 126]
MIGHTHGFPDSDWAQAKAAAREILIRRARLRSRELITYRDFVAQLPLAIAHDDHRLSFLLDEISTEEYAEGRGFLTALVVHQEDWKPGVGFFTMARRCGAEVNNEEAFYLDTFNYLVTYWRAH